MYKICNLLLVLGACTGNRKQSTPQPLSSKPLTFHTAYPISCHAGSGYRGEKSPPRVFCSFYPTHALELFPKNSSPRISAVKWLRICETRSKYDKSCPRKLTSFRNLGVYIENILSHLFYSMYRNYLAAINVHLFIIIYLFIPDPGSRGQKGPVSNALSFPPPGIEPGSPELQAGTLPKELSRQLILWVVGATQLTAREGSNLPPPPQKKTCPNQLKSPSPQHNSMEMGPTQQYGPWILLIYIYIKLPIDHWYLCARV